MISGLLLSGVLALSSQSKVSPPQTPSSLVRVYVHTSESGDAMDVSDRRESVKDLSASLAGKKKTLVIVDDEDKADVVIEVVDRTTTIPRFVFGSPRPVADQPPGSAALAGPSREVHLRVELTSHDESVTFANKNKAIEQTGGWKSAADDLAKQVEKWIVDHRR